MLDKLEEILEFILLLSMTIIFFWIAVGIVADSLGIV